MRACQVCGCASWGPVGNPVEIERVMPWKVSETWTFVRCDNCKAIAREDLLQDVSPTPGPAMQPDAGFPGIMSDLFKQVMPSVPTPPTLMERLVFQIIRSNLILGDKHTDAGDYASRLVLLARQIEWELGQPVTTTVVEHSANPWLVLSFPAREEFERWCTGFWDTVVFPDIPGEYARETYDLAVEFVKGKRHES